MPAKKSLQQKAASTISERIAGALPELTLSHRQMADYVLANSFRAATMTIDELAEATGVSVATANRFAHTLGFDGFPAFRAELVRGFESALAPVEKMRDELSRRASSAEVMAASLSDGLANLETIRGGLPAETCEGIVAALLGARRVLTVGFGDSGYLAGMLAHGLELHCAQVQSLAGVGGSAHGARTLFRLRPRDTVVAISFPRYIRDTVAIARRARERGARIVALTDSPTAPIAPLADLALYVQAASRFNATSNSTIHAVIEALCAAVARQAKNPVKSAAAMTELVLPWLLREGKAE
ncbi:MAG: MurR/RpiR family transcriptional regulator [Candidatus Accumulibacter sp.]|jgi:DNA-binding MurR/RpiR family transcriptional regulator|nr:MurR/RpiR family transcriptional regulator [Accumulibacter sp.]